MEEKKYPNSGRMFKNERKEKDSHPDGDGEGEHTCSKCGHIDRFFINGWRKTGGKGPWWSLSFKDKRQQTQDDTPQPPRKAVQGDLGYGSAAGRPSMSRPLDDEEIPF